MGRCCVSIDCVDYRKEPWMDAGGRRRRKKGRALKELELKCEGRESERKKPEARCNGLPGPHESYDARSKIRA